MEYVILLISVSDITVEYQEDKQEHHLLVGSAAAILRENLIFNVLSIRVSALPVHATG